MPSGINPALGCNPLTGCQSRDHYLPGKGVWAPKQTMGKKAQIGSVTGVLVGAYVGGRTGNPFYAAVGGVTGLLVGHEVGATLDKVDQIHAALVLKNSLNHSPNGKTTQWSNPDNNVVVTATPHTTVGKCREFETTIQVGEALKVVKGTACKKNNEWLLKELYE